MLVYERHDQDTRYKPLNEVCETVSAKYGTGGGNTPIVVILDEEDICGEEIFQMGRGRGGDIAPKP